MRFARKYQDETDGRESTGSRGPVLRPSTFTLDMAAAETVEIDTGGSVDWTDVTNKLPITYADGPLMDDIGQYSIASNDVTLGSGAFIFEWYLLIRNTGAGAHTVQMALINATGATVYNEYPEVDIPAGGNIMLGGAFLTHNAPEDTSDEYAIAVVQRDGAIQEVEVSELYVASSEKIGNGDQSYRL